MTDELASRIKEVARLVKAKGGRLGARLREAEVAAFECEHAVELPREYRRFLIEVGDGDGGGPPEGGLTALGEVPDDYHVEASEVLARLREPFAETEAWIWEHDEEQDEAREAGVLRGALVLGSDGCGLYYLLIVTGAARGQVWMLADVGVTPTDPRIDFLTWYEDWLITGRRWPEG
jgi:hypothetical protein